MDEISHDIPHQNWGEREWDQDLRYMRSVGIDTVIMIRSGYGKFITYPSAHLLSKGCYTVSYTHLPYVVGKTKSKQGRMADALALGGDEGRDKLR